MELTQSEANLIRQYLHEKLPWLGTEDGSDVEYPSGADAVDEIETVYRELGAGGFEVNEEDCTCNDRSWYGPEHDSACELEGVRK